MIPKKENLKLEFKSDLKRLSDSDLLDAVIGMANTEGGQIYLGVEDDGTVTGINKVHDDTIGVIALIANRTVPSISCMAHIEEIKDKRVLIIDVPRSKVVIASSDGKVLRRRLKFDGTPENTPMYPYEYESRLSELELLDLSDKPMVECTIDDFDPIELKRLRDFIERSHGDRELLELDDKELERALRLVKEIDSKTYPTLTGLLLVGKKEVIEKCIPTAETHFQVLDGTDVKVNEYYYLPLLKTIEIFENYFVANNYQSEYYDGLLRVAVPDYSKEAFREGLVNALVHRDYTILDSVKVSMEQDGMTIYSPGSFIEGVDLKNLLYAQPRSRNRSLADCLKRIGLSERTGRGIDRIYEGSIRYGRPLPSYSMSDARSVTLYISKKRADIEFMKLLARSESKLSINELLVLSILRTVGTSPISSLMLSTSIIEERLDIILSQLISLRLIVEAEGYNEKAYRLNPVYYNSISINRAFSTDELVNKIMEYVSIHGSITKEIVIKEFNLSKDKAYRILRKMTDSGKLKLDGRGRSTHYSL